MAPLGTPQPAEVRKVVFTGSTAIGSKARRWFHGTRFFVGMNVDGKKYPDWRGRYGRFTLPR